MLIKKVTKTIFLLILFNNIIFSNALLSDNLSELKVESEKIVEEIRSIPQLRAIAVSKNNKMVTEEYFNGETAYPHERLHIMSVTKSITSLLIGIAIDRGFIDNIYLPIEELINPNKYMMNDKFAKITLKQLLTMQAGFEWNCFDPSEYKNWILSENQVDYIFNKPFRNNPGEKFSYNDGAAHLLSVIISETTGMSTSDFAYEYLFSQIGIGRRQWYVDNQGYNMGGVCLILTVNDMIKIGELVLNDGKYNDKQVISKSWINNSTSKQTMADGHIPYSNEYGYYWWLGEMDGNPYILAMGFGGQFLFIFKELDIVVATLCDYSDGELISYKNSDKIFNSVIKNIIESQYING